jgi:hypothetical protein
MFFVLFAVLYQEIEKCLPGSSKNIRAPAQSSSNSNNSKVVYTGPTAAQQQITLQRCVAESATSIERFLLQDQIHSVNTSTGASASANATAGVGTIGSAPLKKAIQSKQQQSHTISSQYEQVAHERDAKLSETSAELAANSLRQQELTSRKQRLLEQLQACDQELAAMVTKNATLLGQLNSTKVLYQQKLDHLEQTGKLYVAKNPLVIILLNFFLSVRNI